MTRRAWRSGGGQLGSWLAIIPLALLCAGLALAASTKAATTVFAAPAQRATDQAKVYHCPADTQPRSSGRAPGAHFAHTIHVPADQPTIQAAVNATAPGDLVVVAAGVYHEAVIVCTADLTIRGADRNATVLDGQSRLPNGFTVLADNVILENMTAHHYIGNGFFWTNQTGYRGSYLTAYDNGFYGIYAFGSAKGEFDEDYASGNPDSGFYIGQCNPCHAIITRVVAEWNGLGYSGTNASGSLLIEDSEWAHNGAGIAPNTLDTEKLAPEHGATIIGNDVHDNGNPLAPYNRGTHAGIGTGILLAGGDGNEVVDNRVSGNSTYGILVLGNVNKNVWLAAGNEVRRNQVNHSGIADLALGAPSGAGNCFADNRASTTLPSLLELTHPCSTPLPVSGGGDLGVTLGPLAVSIHSRGPGYAPPDYRQIAPPRAQPAMPDVNIPPAPVLLDAVPSSTGAQTMTGDSAMLLPLGFTSYSVIQILLSFYGNLLLFALYSAWLAVAFLELSQRADLSSGRKLAWGVVVLGVPLVGPILYYFASRSKLRLRFRLALVVGAPVFCLLGTLLLLVVAHYTL
jgi:hypothetical protein